MAARVMGAVGVACDKVKAAFEKASSFADQVCGKVKH
jgi:hypothetical protein